MENKNALYATFAFILLFLIITSVVLLNYARVAKPVFNLAPIPPTVWKDVNKSVSGWIGSVANLNKPDDVLPVNLMYIELNDAKSAIEARKSKPKLRYQVFMPRCTDYSIFCMQRIAEALDIELSVMRRGDAHAIFIAAPSGAAANSFVVSLKKYNINSTLKEVK